MDEDAVVSLCSDKLDILIDLITIDRAHRLGTFSLSNNWPIVTRFARYKEKEAVLVARFARYKEREAVLVACSKLKSSKLSTRKDLSHSVRPARRKLFEFSRKQNSVFRGQVKRNFSSHKKAFFLQYVYRKHLQKTALVINLSASGIPRKNRRFSN